MYTEAQIANTEAATLQQWSENAYLDGKEAFKARRSMDDDQFLGTSLHSEFISGYRDAEFEEWYRITHK